MPLCNPLLVSKSRVCACCPGGAGGGGPGEGRALWRSCRPTGLGREALPASLMGSVGPPVSARDPLNCQCRGHRTVVPSDLGSVAPKIIGSQLVSQGKG